MSMRDIHEKLRSSIRAIDLICLARKIKEQQVVWMMLPLTDIAERAGMDAAGSRYSCNVRTANGCHQRSRSAKDPFPGAGLMRRLYRHACVVRSDCRSSWQFCCCG